jgi:PAS domain-containing protein
MYIRIKKSGRIAEVNTHFLNFFGLQSSDCVGKTLSDLMVNKAKPLSLFKRLTYHQALAYYNWKYQKANVFNPSETAIYDDLVPSEEEFKRVQAGEKMMLAAKQIPYPSPLFRYVVHFYKK